MKRNSGKFSWSKLPDEAKDVLGEEFWSDFQNLFPKNGPNVDLYETQTEGTLLLDLPGLHSIEDIDLKKNGTNLIITGNIPDLTPKTKDKPKQIINERFTGPFERSIPIPFSFSTQHVSAKYMNGLLEIRLGKIRNEEQINVRFE
ncbi:Hsp20/alpha crystallin family protein [Gracilibacillus sp. YIM 98692]|uniref:Hsp20/alpha crystallin family protein n=1 Tax=Gracilibacillus sp. YIM 98692 TaxID=2663532 RepID=UPI0013D798D1|nr:Hsp20/alpha crystallin family protein [Gracilibacillus sp. YIM 98692]